MDSELVYLQAKLIIDCKNAFEALCLVHRFQRPIGIDAPGSPRHDPFAMFEFWGEYTVEAGEVETWARHQRRKHFCDS